MIVYLYPQELTTYFDVEKIVQLNMVNPHPFSKSVLKARQLGYDEPDPRDALSGEDVARKMMILSRVCGYRVEWDELTVENLTPEVLRDTGASDFLENLDIADEEWAARLFKIKKTGENAPIHRHI